jgi:hypothetical protein
MLFRYWALNVSGASIYTAILGIDAVNSSAWHLEAKTVQGFEFVALTSDLHELKMFKKTFSFSWRLKKNHHNPESSSEIILYGLA